MDEEELGGVTFEYFVRQMDPDRKKERKDTIRRIFRKYDKNNKGFVTIDDMRAMVYKELNDDIDDDLLVEVQQCYNLVDVQ
jgi:centrin-1